jgi:replication initiation and membrane attachment protein DnaB
MLEDPPPKRRNPVLTRLSSMHLLRFLQMRKKRSYLFRLILPLSIWVVKDDHHPKELPQL